MGKFPVTEKKEKELLAEMKNLGIKDNEIEERFIRCSGHGGQKLNKASTGVYLKHIPSGIEVKCTKERSLGLNRFFARRILVERLKELKGIPTEKQRQIEKIRKRKQKRKLRNKIKKRGDKPLPFIVVLILWLFESL